MLELEITGTVIVSSLASSAEEIETGIKEWLRLNACNCSATITVREKPKKK